MQAMNGIVEHAGLESIANPGLQYTPKQVYNFGAFVGIHKTGPDDQNTITILLLRKLFEKPQQDVRAQVEQHCP